MLYFTGNGRGGIRRKRYLEEMGGRIVTNLWNYNEVGHTDEASKELKALFGGSSRFDTPKPTRLIERILQIATDPDSIILDSFAGSGTTAHAVLNLNQQDGGNRKFILVEMEDYAESITAERVRRVMEGYADVEGTGGNFSFYELGEPLLLDNKYLNENVPL
jgi:adenine-specific DNA-methyltransferase